MLWLLLLCCYARSMVNFDWACFKRKTDLLQSTENSCCHLVMDNNPQLTTDSTLTVLLMALYIM